MPNILDDHLTNFRSKCDWALQVYFDTVSLFNENQVNGFTADMKYMIIENIILTVYSSWEKFLEDTFISYMQGNISENGTAITVYVSPTSDDHAYNLIKNVTTYPDWTDVNKIMINAGNFFENDLIKKYHRKAEDTSAKAKIITEETDKKKTKMITYEGPVSGVKDTLDQVAKDLFSKDKV